MDRDSIPVGAALLQAHFSAHGNEGEAKETFYGYHRDTRESPFHLYKFVYSGSRVDDNGTLVSDDGWSIIQKRDDPFSDVWEYQESVIVTDIIVLPNKSMMYKFRRPHIKRQTFTFIPSYFSGMENVEEYQKTRIIGNPPWYNMSDMNFPSNNTELTSYPGEKHEIFKNSLYKPLEIPWRQFGNIPIPDLETLRRYRNYGRLTVARPKENSAGGIGCMPGTITFFNENVKQGGFKCMVRVHFDYEEDDIPLYFDPEDIPILFYENKANVKKE